MSLPFSLSLLFHFISIGEGEREKEREIHIKNIVDEAFGSRLYSFCSVVPSAMLYMPMPPLHSHYGRAQASLSLAQTTRRRRNDET
jgi:hypothetical protein